MIVAIDLSKYKKLSPIDDKVIIKKLKTSDRSSGGVLLPETAVGQEQKGIIVAVGPGLKEMTSDKKTKQLLTEDNQYVNEEHIKRIGMQLKVGDLVLYTTVSGLKFNFEGEELIVQREVDIISIIKEDE